jgi:hypothetical protein
LRKTRDFLLNNPDSLIPPKVINELSKLEKLRPQDLSTEQIKNLNDTIKHLKHLNDTKNKILFGKKYKETKEFIDSGIENLKKRKPIIPNTDFDPNIKKSSRGKALNYLTNPEFMTEVMDGGRGGVIQDVLFKGVNKGRNVQNRYILDAQDFVKKGIGDIDTAKYSKEVGGKKTPTEDFKLESGKSLKLTKGQKVALYLHSLNNKNLKHVVDGGVATKDRPEAIIKLTQKDIDNVLKTMNADDKKVAGVVYDFYNNVQKNRLNEASTEINGFRIAREDDYYPINVVKLAIRKDPTKMQGFYQQTLEGQGFTKERVSSGTPIVLDDVFSDLARNVQSTSAYIGLASPLRSAKAMLLDPTFKKEVIRRFGPSAQAGLEDYLRTVEGDSFMLTDDLSKVTKGIINRATTSVLGANPWVMLKQPVSYIGAATEMSGLDLAKALPTTLKYMAKGVDKTVLDDMLKYSPELAMRAKGNATRELGEVSQNKSIRRFWKDSKGIAEASMSGIKRFDMATIGGIWKASEFEIKKKFPELKGDAFKEKVAERAEEVVRLTQPTFDIKDRTGTSRVAGKNPLVNILTKFSSQRQKNVIMVSRAVHKYKTSGRTVKDKLKLTKDLAIVTMLMPMMIGAINDARDKVFKRDKKKEFKGKLVDLVENNLNNIVGLSLFVTPVRDKLQKGLWRGFSSRDLLTGTFNDMANTITRTTDFFDQLISQERFARSGKDFRAGELKWEKNLDKTVKSLLNTTGKLTGIPVQNIGNIIKAAKINIEGEKKNGLVPFRGE